MSLPKSTQLNGTNSKYRIEKMMGQGGFGIVYAASDSQGKRVAIKEYFPNMLATRIDGSTQVNPNTNDPEAKELFNEQKERFLQEAEHMKRFKNDPHIVNVLDCFEANGTAYIVMEFIKGNTLAKVLEKVPNHRLLLKNVIDDLAPIVDVLELIHSNKSKDSDGNDVVLIHRDISPDNIIFSAKTAILLDFGAARMVSPGGKFTLTQITKRYYSPPEQFLETENSQGTWSDVYALAATIYKAITGELVPHAQTRDYKFYHDNVDILKPPSAFGVEINKQQEQALIKGLALKRQDRYQTVREFFNALKGSSPQQKKKCLHCGREYDASLTKCPYSDCPSNQTATQIKCPKCNRYYDINLTKCPYSDCPSNQTTIDKRPWIAAGCAILIAFASFGYTNSVKTQLAKITEETKELKSQTSRYDYISNNFGYGSSAYYADTPVLVIDKNEETIEEKTMKPHFIEENIIPIYWSSWNDSQTTEMDANISAPEGIHVEWDSKVTNQRRNAIVTSGSESGAYIVHFSNKKNNDAFDVLVVVK